MQWRGVPADRAVLLQHTALVTRRQKQLEREAARLAPSPAPMNLLSHAQVRTVLYDTLRLDAGLVLGRTRELQAKSTDEAALRRLGDAHPLPRVVRGCRCRPLLCAS